MAYSKQNWVNDDPATPLSAARLNHVETGIESAAFTADSAASAAASAQSTASSAASTASSAQSTANGAATTASAAATAAENAQTTADNAATAAATADGKAVAAQGDADAALSALVTRLEFVSIGGITLSGRFVVAPDTAAYLASGQAEDGDIIGTLAP